MTTQNKRWVEIRMLVTVSIDVTDARWHETLKIQPINPSTLASIVASEVVSNLESLPFVGAAIVTTL